jgi:malonyl CoA-acyl carrier protein transacylase
MKNQYHKAVAIVGVGAVMPDAHNLPQFWSNIKNGVYSITDVPADRWDKARYYDPDPKVPDKAYSTIGGWVTSFDWDPIKWRLPIPPKVADLMDLTQKYAIAASREALLDFDFENKDFDRERTAVIFGNAMGGDQHLYSAARALFPEFAYSLQGTSGFSQLPASVRQSILEEMNAGLPGHFVPITEDTMPGELSNIAAGRIAALFDLRGMNYVTDAACASALAGVSAAVNGLLAHDYDLVVTGGTDANMSPSTFVKFCKIGALSARDSRPYAKGADGFVMGEGAAVFVMKRLEDAERDGDKIYAVFRSMGGSSDGKGKGITAPNPKGQILAVKRAWERIGLSPVSVGLIEGHGTSTTVGDAAELQSMVKVFDEFRLPAGSVALGSVKGNIGHLKGGAGAAGLMKATMALYEKVLPPSLNFHEPNPNVDFDNVPFRVNTELRPWELNGKEVRRCGVSAFGFGGTNFHAVLEEYIPGKITSEEKKQFAVSLHPGKTDPGTSAPKDLKKPIRGVVLLGAETDEQLINRLEKLVQRSAEGWTPPIEAPLEKDLEARNRICIDFGNADELNDKAQRALKALQTGKQNMWKVLNAKGVFYGSGKPGKAAFLYTGQGSQYINMLRELRDREPVVRDTFREADEIMTPLLGRPLTDFIFIDESDKARVTEADHALKQTEITQPAMLTADTALYRLMGEYGVKPDMVIGHSLGEYGALVASGALGFKDALLAVSARGHQMAKVKVEDKGMMAAVFASPDQIEEVLKDVSGYVVIANINSYGQSVIGGATRAVEEAMQAAKDKGYHVSSLPVSHAFHTEIVAPASGPLREVLADFDIRKPVIPIISNVTGDFYPTYDGMKEEMLDLLSKQVASPVQFVKGINNLYDNGARVFVEMGPKKALNGFVRDILGDKNDVSNLFTNHPKVGELESFNQALCGMYAAGLGFGRKEEVSPMAAPEPVQRESIRQQPMRSQSGSSATRQLPDNRREQQYLELGKMFVDFLEKADSRLTGEEKGFAHKDVWITGAALGLPGVERVFSDDNVKRILRGDQFIQLIPEKYQQAMLAKNVTRLVKTGKGGPRFVTIDKIDEVIKLAGRRIDLDIVRDFDFPKARMEALDEVSALAIGAGIDALRDAGIPMVMNYRETSKGSELPDRWLLPEDMRDDTGIIFASAFPGYNQYATQMTNYFNEKIYRGKLETLIDMRDKLTAIPGSDQLISEVNDRIDDLSKHIEENAFVFDRRFLFQVLAMGHSQFAEYIGARGPNTSMNAACASTTQAVAMANDWIQMNRCNRVLVIAADDITGENTLEWFASGFIATGAAATDDKVENAALPFDRRRHGMIIGMGGASLVVENREAAEKRGITPIAEVLSSVLANSAFHGTRLDVSHIKYVMEKLVSDAEKQWGINRFQIAPETVFISHETYTPARGGSAAAEIEALNYVFRDAANEIVIANTKGFTGHPMGVGIEDVIAVKILETGMVPPIPNFREVDPELGDLNLSRGGSYPVQYALRLAAGFGSQISMTLYRWYPTVDGKRRSPDELNFEYRIRDKQQWNNWLKQISGKENPAIEVFKRTLRVKDEFGSALNGDQDKQALKHAVIEETHQAVVQPADEYTGSADPVMNEILQLISQKTGYPADMLHVDLDLEADLGIDTVKQAELFADIRGNYQIPQDDSIVLSNFPTLQHIINFVYERRPDLASARSARSAAPSAPATQKAVTEPQVSQETGVVREILTLIAGKTGYPPDMLDTSLDLEADLGIDTVKQAELFADVRGLYDIPQDDSIELAAFPTLQHIIDFVYEKRPDLVSAEPIQPVAQAPVSPVPTVQPVVETGTSNQVVDEILALIAEKTGYPPEMLDPELDLEADLGIDTVKQAELFADIRGLYDIPQDDSIDLSDYPTLNHIIRFVEERMPEGAVKPQMRQDRLESPGIETALMQGDWDAIAQIPRRIPTPVLRPQLSYGKPTGVDIKGSRIVIKSDEGKIGEALVKLLEKEGAEVLEIEGDPDPDALNAILKAWTDKGKVNGLYWLPALDKESPLKDMSYDQWKALTYNRIKLLYHTTRQLELLGQKGMFLVSATRLGGMFGYDDEGAVAPIGGAVSGYTKAYKRENPESLVKVIDFEPSRKTKALAEIILDETLRDTGAVEIGYKHDRRWTIGLKEEAQLEGNDGLVLDQESVYLITGGAGSITSAITADLASANKGVFHLMDLTPEPDRNDPDILKFSTDKEGLKRDLFERLKASGEKPTPVNVGKLLGGIERKHAALSAIQAIEQAGAKVHYHAVNLLDHQAVKKAIDKITQTEKKIDVFMHAGGLEISRMLRDKEPGEFNLVFDVKADGWYNILSALGDFPVHAAVVFSSIAGRFGNGGQVDYSAANDFLCKSTSAFKGQGNQTRGIAFDWTAWGGIGMAARGSIPMVMKQAGIDMLPPEAGIPFVRKELIAGTGTKEVVVAQSLGLMLREFDPQGGIEVEALGKALTGKQLMVQNVNEFGLYSGMVVSAEFDPNEQGFLYDHQINEIPVLPGVMGIEAMTSAAKAFVPDLQVVQMRNVSFFAPFKFYKSEPREVFVTVQFRLEGTGLVADCELYGLRQLVGQDQPQRTTHFRAEVIFSQEKVEKPEALDKKWLKQPKEAFELDDDDIYQVYFHGPAYQVVDEAWRNGNYFIAEMEDDLPDNHQPAKLKTITDPRLIEHCFQAAGIHLLGTDGIMGLPAGAKSVKWYQPWDGKSKVLAVIEKTGEGYDAKIVDKKGEVILEIEGYTTAAFPMSVTEDLLEPFKKVVK